MADKINGIELGIVFPTKKAIKTGGLTGRAGKEHVASFFQFLPDLPVAVSHRTLDILRAPELRKRFLGLYPDMPHMQLLIHGGTVYDAPFFQNCLGKECKGSAGGAVKAQRLVL